MEGQGGKRRCATVTLMPHQVEHTARIVETLQLYGAAIDSSEMGTGKTYVAIRTAQLLGASAVVVVCPNAVERKWCKLMGGARTETALVTTYTMLARSARKNGLAEFDGEVRMREAMLSTSGHLRTGVKKTWAVSVKPELEAYAGRQGVLLVLDETHRVKNDTTQAASGVSALVSMVRGGGGWVLHLSATPLDHARQLDGLLRMVLSGRPGRTPRDFARGLAGGKGEAEEGARRKAAEEMAARFVGGGDVMMSMRRLAQTGGDTGPFWEKVNRAVDMATRNPLALVSSVSLAEGVREVAGGATIPPSLALTLALQLPLAANLLQDDVAAAVDVLLFGLPRLIHRMEAAESEFKRFDMNLFLEGADVADSVIEMTLLPAYRRLHTHAAQAPLTSPSGAAHVPEREMPSWRTPSWRFGGERPMRVWEEVERLSPPASEARREAEVMRRLCAAAWVEAQGVDDEEEGGGTERDPRIELELAKVGPLGALLRRILAEDAEMKAVVMFNYLEPLARFSQLMSDYAPMVVRGSTSPKRRHDAVERFNSTSSPSRVLACTINVLNEGIDLHDTRGGERRVTFIMACPSVIGTQQAQGRIHRAGVMSHAINCVVYGGYALGGEAEERLLRRQAAKTAVVSFMQRRAAPAACHNIRSSDAFVHAFRAIHAHGALPADAPPPSTPSLLGEDCFSGEWARREVLARCWHLIAPAVAAGGEEMERFAREWYDIHLRGDQFNTISVYATFMGRALLNAPFTLQDVRAFQAADPALTPTPSTNMRGVEGRSVALEDVLRRL